MKRTRRTVAVLVIAPLVAGTTWLLTSSSADAHDCVIVGTPVMTIQSAPDCTSFLDDTTTTHECTGTGNGIGVFLCQHIEG